MQYKISRINLKIILKNTKINLMNIFLLLSLISCAKTQIETNFKIEKVDNISYYEDIEKHSQVSFLGQEYKDAYNHYILNTMDFKNKKGFIEKLGVLTGGQPQILVKEEVEEFTFNFNDFSLVIEGLQKNELEPFIKNSFNALFVYPKKPMQIGGSWTNNKSYNLYQEQKNYNITYIFDKEEGDYIYVSGIADEQGTFNLQTLLGLEEDQLLNYTIKRKEDYVLLKDSFLVKEYNSVMNITGKAEIIIKNMQNVSGNKTTTPFSIILEEKETYHIKDDQE